MTTATAAHCHSSLIVTPTGFANRAAQQRLLWLVYANFVKGINGLIPECWRYGTKLLNWHN
jgi:hypothetical protein